MAFINNLFSAIGRFLSRRPTATFFDRKPLGPVFEQLSGDMIRIQEGELAGQEFKLSTAVTDDEAHVFLHQNDRQIGHCDLQLKSQDATVSLWNIIVEEKLRHKGLASMMTFVGFRRMLELYRSASFAIRMVRLIKPSDRITKIQNVGIGVIARKLGFSPEYNLEALLRQRNIQLIELIRSDGIMPPGYRIVLRIFPLVLIAFLVDPVTNRPFPDGHRIYNSLVTPENAETWAKEGMIIIGNGNYMLRREGLQETINHLATTPTEAAIMARRIKPL